MIPALRRWAPELLVAAVTAAVVVWRIDVPSPWRDEGATWLAARRALPDLLTLTRTVDLVHLPYYLLAHLVLSVHDSVTALRLLSAAAMAATAALLVMTGRRLGSPPVGVTAGLLLAVAPLTSRYGQEARPYALAALTAALAGYTVVRATEPEAGRRVRVGYVAAVVGTGLANVLGLLVLAGHAAFVLACRRAAWRTWLASCVAALAVLSPFLVATSAQRGQVGWLTRPDAGDLVDVLAAPFGGWLVPGVVLGLTVLAAAARPARVHRPALILGAAWGLAPPLLLWTVSQWQPLFDGRYAVAALPGAALALAAVCPRVPCHQAVREVGAAVTIVLVVAIGGWPEQLRHRDPESGHGEDVRGVVRLLAGHTRRGDAVLFVPYHLRIVALMAPPGSPLPDDVALGRDARTSATLTGVDVAAGELLDRIAGRDRLWLVTRPAGLTDAATDPDAAKLAVLSRDYREEQRYEVHGFVVVLYLATRGDDRTRG